MHRIVAAELRIVPLPALRRVFKCIGCRLPAESMGSPINTTSMWSVPAAAKRTSVAVWCEACMSCSSGDPSASDPRPPAGSFLRPSGRPLASTFLPQHSYWKRWPTAPSSLCRPSGPDRASPVSSIWQHTHTHTHTTERATN